MNVFKLFHALFNRRARAGTARSDFASLYGYERRRRPRINPRKGTRFLIIDDSLTVTMALRKLLSSVGCQTLVASNAELGLELARGQQPDLIFLDIVLPGMNGFAALRSLRRDPRTSDIPVIMMSGDEQVIEQLYGTRINADAFMKKPFSRSEVFARIEAMLDGQQVPRRGARDKGRTILSVA